MKLRTNSDADILNNNNGSSIYDSGINKTPPGSPLNGDHDQGFFEMPTNSWKRSKTEKRMGSEWIKTTSPAPYMSSTNLDKLKHAYRHPFEFISPFLWRPSAEDVNDLDAGLDLDNSGDAMEDQGLAIVSEE